MARLKAHEEAERVHKLAEESEMKVIQDALGRERDRERELRQKLDMEAEAARREREEVMQREMKESEDRQERRRRRTQGEKVWGGWRRELGVSAPKLFFSPLDRVLCLLALTLPTCAGPTKDGADQASAATLRAAF